MGKRVKKKDFCEQVTLHWHLEWWARANWETGVRAAPTEAQREQGWHFQHQGEGQTWLEQGPWKGTGWEEIQKQAKNSPKSASQVNSCIQQRFVEYPVSARHGLRCWEKSINQTGQHPCHHKSWTWESPDGLVVRTPGFHCQGPDSSNHQKLF